MMARLRVNGRVGAGVMALEAVVLLAVGLFCWSYGWQALSSYVSALKIVGAIIMLAGVLSSYRTMIAPPAEEADGARLADGELAFNYDIRHEIGLRYAGFKRIVFFCAAGFIAFGIGALLETVLL
ncbi:MAG: hypothetical protein R3A44_04815 [Caldilineaceae bacterium]